MLPFPQLVQYGNTIAYPDPGIVGTITSGTTAPGAAAAENRFCGNGQYMYMTNQVGSQYRYNADANTWSQITTRPVSTLRNSGIATTPSGNFVLAGGYNNSGGVGSNRFDSYSPASTTWTQIGTIPSSTWNVTLISVTDSTFYLVHAPSGNGTGTVFSYWNGSSWTNLTAPGFGGTSNGYYYNGAVYINNNSPRRLMKYTVSTNTWSTAYTMNNTTANPIFCGYNKWIYLWSNANGLYKYNADTGEGSLVTSLTSDTRVCVGMNFYNNKLYAMFTNNTIAVVA
ncbi:hypothetical protein XbC2_585 [Xanthomonas phage XbC2]|nr:hypothetical protein XbC2_585 [Xanthomonas phage XbC2]